MTPDSRSGDKAECQLCKHFDNFSYKSKLVPYKDSEDIIATTQAINGLQTFLMYGGNMFGLGTKSRDLDYASLLRNTDIPGGGTWNSPTNGEAANGIVSFGLFINYYGVLYFYSSGLNKSGICAYDIANTTLYQDNTVVLEATGNVGLVHSANNILFIGSGNIVRKKNNSDGSTPTTGWTTTALTLPTGFVITDFVEDGLYLVMSGYNSDGKYISYFWDMSATSWEDTKTIIWGEGTSRIIVEKIDGYLVAVSIEGSLSPRLVFRKSYGGLQVKFKEIYLKSGGASTIFGGQKYNGRLFFGLNATSVGGTTYDYNGIWSVGSNGEGGFSVNLDRLPNNDTAVDSVKGFIIVQDYVYISHLKGATYSLSKTNDQTSYTAQSIYETQKFFIGDSSLIKNLLEVSLTCEKLPANATAKLYYRIDGATSWGTAFLTISTTDRLSEYINKSIGDYKEIEFRLESYKGAVITGVSFIEEIIGKKKQ